MVERRKDEFNVNHLINGAVLSAIVAVPLAFISTTIGVVVLIGLAFVCGWFGGRDAGVGSAGAGTFMFFFAATEPHFQLEIQNERDQVLIVVCFVGSLLAQEIGVRLYRR